MQIWVAGDNKYVHYCSHANHSKLKAGCLQSFILFWITVATPRKVDVAAVLCVSCCRCRLYVLVIDRRDVLVCLQMQWQTLFGIIGRVGSASACLQWLTVARSVRDRYLYIPVCSCHFLHVFLSWSICLKLWSVLILWCSLNCKRRREGHLCAISSSVKAEGQGWSMKPRR